MRPLRHRTLRRLHSRADAVGWRYVLTGMALVVAALVIASLVRGPFSSAQSPERAQVAERTPTAQPARAFKTVVSLTFNGGTPSQYRLAGAVLRQFGFHGTFYVPTGRLDRAEACCMSWDQARDLYNSGDEIGGSDVDGVDLTVRHSKDAAEDRAYKGRQICGTYDRLRRLGFDPRSFAYPGGAYRNADAGSTVSLPRLVKSCGYLTARIVGGLSQSGDQQANALPPTDPYVVRTPDEVKLTPLSLDDLQRPVLVAARAGRGWVPLVFDEICRQGDAGYTACMSSRRPVDASVLADFLSWLSRAGQAGGAPAGTGVETVRQAMGAPPQPPLPVPGTIVSLTFDDGDATQVLAGRMLHEHGMRATFFVNSGPIDAGNPYYMTWQQLRQLQREGNEVGGHTRDHVNLTDSRMSLQKRRGEVCVDRRRLLALGFAARSFAYPEGAVDRVAETLPRVCGYRSARTAGGVSPNGPQFAEQVPPADRFATLALDGPGSAERRDQADVAGRPMRLEDLQRPVIAAAAHGGGWVQIVLHRVCASLDPLFARCMSGQDPVDDQTLETFLNWLHDSAPQGTVVRTVNDALDARR